MNKRTKYNTGSSYIPLAMGERCDFNDYLLAFLVATKSQQGYQDTKIVLVPIIKTCHFFYL